VTCVKICGIKNAADRDCVVSSGANAIGFVVEIQRSKRNISREEARSLIQGLPPFITSVIVTEPESAKEAADLAKDTGADAIQIHGTLSPEDLKALKEVIPQKIIAAAGVNSKESRKEGNMGFEGEVRRFARFSDAILLDTVSGDKLGGTGEVHDWDLSSKLVRELKVPVVLAGGLDPENVAEAVKKVRPYAVDVSSGVETNCAKDHQKITSFVREVMSCSHQ